MNSFENLVCNQISKSTIRTNQAEPFAVVQLAYKSSENNPFQIDSERI